MIFDIRERGNSPVSQMKSTEATARAARYENGFRVLQGRREYVTYLADSSIRIWYSDIPWRYESHDHSAVEVLLTLEGMVTYTVEDRIYHVRKGEVLIVPPDTLHSLSMGEGSSRYLFLFESDALMAMRDLKAMASYFHKPFHLRDGSDAHVRVRELLLRAQDAYDQHDMLWNTICYSCLLQIYVTLGQRYLSGVRRASGDAPGNMDSEVINSVMTFINNHYREELTLEDVAKFAGFSRYYFSRTFKRQTGYSFKDYLCQKRLQVAMDLLIRTNRPMRDVALESGFGSVATFNRVFRESKGCTPTQYRVIYGI